MKYRPAILAAGVAAMLATAGTSAAPLANQLRNHASPYLAMHAPDPVAWQDWSPAVMERARREGKLVYLSIGYFACHWCHVMQRESYRNPDIARFLNEQFIPVKIDRELEPVLDQRMIEFAEKTRGQSGWPLNVFLTPDGHPLYAVLYQPPQEFLDGIRQLQALWAADPAKLKQLAQQEAVKAEGPGAPRLDRTQVQQIAAKAVRGAMSIADSIQGGFGEQSKFPSVPPLFMLLDAHRHSPTKELATFLQLTLDQMAALGLYDHVGGGFFRYAVDPSWKTPHFEKMLYDNALLARLYLKAARTFDRADYAQVARETLDFMARDMAGGEGALIASLSALDDKDVEGGYYLWSAAELEAVLPGEERVLYRRVYGMTDAAPFEAGYLPLRVVAVDEAARALGMDVAEARVRLAHAQKRLSKKRASRVLPRDSKRLAAWNGLALYAFSEAAAQFGDARYREVARGLRNYLVGTLWDGRALKRSVANGRSLGTVSLEDYAYVAEGLAAWASLTAAPEDWGMAEAVAEAGWRRHYGKSGWRLSVDGTPGDGGVDVVADGPMPAPSAVLCRTSLGVAANTGNAALSRRALSALNGGHRILGADPFWYASHVATMREALMADMPRQDFPEVPPDADIGRKGRSKGAGGG